MKNKLHWQIVHDADDENGNPTQWVAEINHPKYGTYCWISDATVDSKRPEFIVEVSCVACIELKRCKSLSSAKRWVATNLQ